MDYENKDWEMSFGDLFLNIFYKWKGIAAVALVFALLLGGYQAWNTIQNNAKEPAAKDVAEYNRDMGVLEKQLVNAEKLLTEKEEYLLNAPLMQMDSEHAYVANAYLFIRTDYQIMPGMDYQNVDESSSILTVYQNVLNDRETMVNISQELGVETNHLSGLIEVDKETTHLLRIRVYHSDAAVAQEILDLLLQHVDAAGESAAELICAHTAEVMMKSVDPCYDFSTISTKQETQYKKLSTYQKDVDDLSEKIDKLKKSNPVRGKKSVAGQTVLWSALGFVAGAIIGAVLVCLAFCFRTTVYSARELGERTHLRVLGTIPANTVYRDPVIRLLRKLEGRTGRGLDEDLDLIAENITNYYDGARQILVIGTADMDKIGIFTEAIREKIGDVRLLAGGDILQDADALRSLRQCDAVILMEASGKSSYQKILREAAKADSLGKKVVGCVVID